MSSVSLIDQLEQRGLLHQMTASREAIVKHLATPGRVAYAGFDPTRDSLTIGNLVAITLLRHVQRAGHRPIALVGGGTGLIGDPSGKDSERKLQSREQIDANVAGQRRVLERFLDFSPSLKQPALLVNNADWLCKLSYIEVLRDIGKHFSVNAMIARDSVRDRLENREQGISYTEFSYMLLQAYDFLHLKREHGCSIQLAGSDQFGNIVSGIDLIHRVQPREGDAAEAFGITAPLITGADGKKIGKSEHGAIFLTADRTSPYAFYQYFVNVEDADVLRLLRLFTFLSTEELATLETAHASAPHERAAHKALAGYMTELVHGQTERERAEHASKALFGGDVRGLDARTLDEVFADVPHSDHDKSALEGEGVLLLDLLTQTTLASSKREARQLLESGAVLVNGDKASLTSRLQSRDLLHGQRILLRRGKKLWHATRWA